LNYVTSDFWQQYVYYVQAGSAAYPTSYSMGIKGSFPMGSPTDAWRIHSQSSAEVCFHGV